MSRKLVEHVEVLVVWRENHVSRAVTCVRANWRRLVGRELPGCAVEGELQHLIGADCRRVDKLVTPIRQNRMRIATSGNDLNRFHLNESIFTNWANRKLVATIGGGEQETSGAIGRDIGHAVRQRRRRFLR